MDYVKDVRHDSPAGFPERGTARRQRVASEEGMSRVHIRIKQCATE
jgi:hypothetical protein